MEEKGDFSAVNIAKGGGKRKKSGSKNEPLDFIPIFKFRFIS